MSGNTVLVRTSSRHRGALHPGSDINSLPPSASVVRPGHVDRLLTANPAPTDRPGTSAHPSAVRLSAAPSSSQCEPGSVFAPAGPNATFPSSLYTTNGRHPSVPAAASASRSYAVSQPSADGLSELATRPDDRSPTAVVSDPASASAPVPAPDPFAAAPDPFRTLGPLDYDLAPSDAVTESVVKPAERSTEPAETGQLCMLCLTRPKNASLVHGSTGHQVCCFKCGKRLRRRGRPCPVCRKKIQKVIKNYIV